MPAEVKKTPAPEVRRGIEMKKKAAPSVRKIDPEIKKTIPRLSRKTDSHLEKGNRRTLKKKSP